MADNDLNPSVDEREMMDTPEDVAILYSWANMHGAKYRDFSASRREYRAQLRQKAMEAQREAELKAAQEREEMARREEEAARRVASESSSDQRMAVEAEEAVLRAQRSRDEAARHAHAAALAEKAAQDAEREVEEARRRAAEQAARYAESDSRRRAFAGPQPGEIPGEVSDPYHYSGHVQPQHISGSSSGIRNSAAGRGPSEPQRPVRDVASEERRAYENGGRGAREKYFRDGRSDSRTEERNLVRRERPEEETYREGSPRTLIPSPARSQSAGLHRAADDRREWIPPRHENPNEPVNPEVYHHLGETELEAIERERRKLEDRARGVRHPDMSHEIVRDPERGNREERIETVTQPRPLFEDESRQRAREQAEEHIQMQRRIEQQQAAERQAAEAERVRRDDELRRREQTRLEAERRAEDQRREEAELIAQQQAAEDERLRVEKERSLKRQAEAEEARLVEERRRRDASLREQYGVAESGLHVSANSSRDRVRPPGRSIFTSTTGRPAASPLLPETAASRPAWLYDEQGTARPQPMAEGALNDTLQHSRERVAARWFALKELMGQTPEAQPQTEMAESRPREILTPTVAVISLAGGVGKTSLVATLGRTLSAMGEKVLLAATGSNGMLPYYFGSRELRSGVVRTFSPPVGSPDAPVYMVNYDADTAAFDHGAQDHLYSELMHASRGIHRVLLDLNSNSVWLAKRLAKINPVILVPLAPDMNSILGIQSMERMLGGVTDNDGRPIQPFYVLNQFDASLPLHLDVREAMRQTLGDRLLPIVIRRAPAVSEALAEGMTVMDYAPASQVAEDYTQLANWIRSLTAPATSVFRGMRWSEG